MLAYDFGGMSGHHHGEGKGAHATTSWGSSAQNMSQWGHLKFKQEDYGLPLVCTVSCLGLGKV